MSEKRFKIGRNALGMKFICYDGKCILMGTFADTDGLKEVVDLLNEEEYLNRLEVETLRDTIRKLEKENEQLKETIKEVHDLLVEEVDVFTDKATEHDVCAYVELGQLDNKDAYYMAVSTKKAIKLLKEYK